MSICCQQMILRVNCRYDTFPIHAHYTHYCPFSGIWLPAIHQVITEPWLMKKVPRQRKQKETEWREEDKYDRCAILSTSHFQKYRLLFRACKAFSVAESELR